MQAEVEVLELRLRVQVVAGVAVLVQPTLSAETVVLTLVVAGVLRLKMEFFQVMAAQVM
jgi:hypothetical protein